MSKYALARICLLSLTICLAGCSTRNPYYQSDGPQPVVDAPDPDQWSTMGKLGGPCFPNKTCDHGLVCDQGTCVRADGGHKDGTNPGDASGDGTGPGNCTPPGEKKLLFKSDSRGDWTVALELLSTYKSATIAGGKAIEAASTMDYNVAGVQVAGFAVSRSTSAKAVKDLVGEVLKDLEQDLKGKVTVVATGASATSHDGYPMISGTTADISLGSASDVSSLRNQVLSELLNISLTKLSGLPASWGVPSINYTLRLSTVLRKDSRVVFVGAVLDKKADQDKARATHIIATDLASGTALARKYKPTANHCDKKQVSTPLTPVDFIWVMDESGSMKTKRDDIAISATNFFTYAQNAGLDFRMGVTNVCNPKGGYAKSVGVFCSKISTQPTDLGGTDRFLLPTEQAIFSACIKNPPGLENGAEFGLVNAEEAVKKHLPRATSKTDKIRTGAQVVIIVVTDEFPQSIASTIGGGNYKTCTLDSATQTKVNGALKPLQDYFSGTKNKETKVDYFQAIAGTCNNTCNAFVAHGYKEMAAKFKGTVYDVCEKNVGASINKIIDTILLAKSPHILKYQPIAASLAVAINSKIIQRSLLNGFDYLPATNSLSFHGTAKPTKGSTVVTSYQSWK